MGMFDDLLKYLQPPSPHGPPTPQGQAPAQLGGIQSMLSRPGIAEGLLAAAGQWLEPHPNMGAGAQAFSQGLSTGQERHRQGQRDKIEQARMELEAEKMRREQEAQAKEIQYYETLAAQGNPAAKAMLAGVSPERYGMLNPQPEYMEVPQGDQTVLVRKSQGGMLEPTQYSGPRFKNTPDVQINMGAVPQGYRLVNKDTPEERLEPIPGAPLTEFQAASKNYVERMREAEKLMESVQAGGYDPKATMEHVKAGVPVIGNFLASKDFQLYRQAQEDWVRAKLRKESGATIRDEEMESEIRTYFPRPGDSPEVVKQKAQARRVAEQALALGLEGHGARVEPAETPTAAAGQYSDEDLEYTAKKYGITVDEVRHRLEGR